MCFLSHKFNFIDYAFVELPASHVGSSFTPAPWGEKNRD
jgi:hypothetical protein